MTRQKKVGSIMEHFRSLVESQDFNPVLGKDVEKENKKNNKVRVIKNNDDYDEFGVLKSRKENTSSGKHDYNKTLLDLHYPLGISKEQKDKIKSQIKGFDSVAHEKATKKEKRGGNSVEGNERFYNQRKERNAQIVADKQRLKHSGLTAREFPKERFTDKTVFTNESKRMKRLHFNKTTFINESVMLSKIPDELKVDGNVFLMRDKVGNEYMVECVSDNVVKEYVHTNVISYTNKAKINEALEKAKALYNYNSSDSTMERPITNEKVMVGRLISEAKNKLVNVKERRDLML